MRRMIQQSVEQRAECGGVQSVPVHPDIVPEMCPPQRDIGGFRVGTVVALKLIFYSSRWPTAVIVSDGAGWGDRAPGLPKCGATPQGVDLRICLT